MLDFHGHGFTLFQFPDGRYKIGTKGNSGSSYWIVTFETEDKPELEVNIEVWGYLESSVKDDGKVKKYPTVFKVTKWSKIEA